MSPLLSWLWLLSFPLMVWLAGSRAVETLYRWFPPRVDEIDWCAAMRPDEYERRVQR